MSTLLDSYSCSGLFGYYLLFPIDFQIEPKGSILLKERRYIKALKEPTNRVLFQCVSLLFQCVSHIFSNLRGGLTNFSIFLAVFFNSLRLDHSTSSHSYGANSFRLTCSIIVCEACLHFCEVFNEVTQKNCNSSWAGLWARNVGYVLLSGQLRLPELISSC